ncbi:hypothetical protein Q7C36_004094 [Tachysurus vachellii]|uniref:Uncharacterized protein n=1 Tax=Tachysurus vachellii TaxID=175792 RepID=A0AA88NWQ0_TACVA|nr:hypothetical protein Q7C36_004091 [Tachysurus vachellii]KAK2864938.1 hypothetical protein Q7C36_004092 [Tachysurus vachellii]KAK2864939.1 hypothetical protein Q7C36_004093 [Tachysurus vachellii]KAK2864940.1 hypothetical protein Q7C36_004094 [Tachysurus vachellii]
MARKRAEWDWICKLDTKHPWGLNEREDAGCDTRQARAKRWSRSYLGPRPPIGLGMLLLTLGRKGMILGQSRGATRKCKTPLNSQPSTETGTPPNQAQSHLHQYNLVLNHFHPGR